MPVLKPSPRAKVSEARDRRASDSIPHIPLAKSAPYGRKGVSRSKTQNRTPVKPFRASSSEGAELNTEQDPSYAPHEAQSRISESSVTVDDSLPIVDYSIPTVDDSLPIVDYSLPTVDESLPTPPVDYNLPPFKNDIFQYNDTETDVSALEFVPLRNSENVEEFAVAPATSRNHQVVLTPRTFMRAYDAASTPRDMYEGSTQSGLLSTLSQDHADISRNSSNDEETIALEQDLRRQDGVQSENREQKLSIVDLSSPINATDQSDSSMLSVVGGPVESVREEVEQKDDDVQVAANGVDGHGVDGHGIDESESVVVNVLCASHDMKKLEQEEKKESNRDENMKIQHDKGDSHALNPDPVILAEPVAHHTPLTKPVDHNAIIFTPTASTTAPQTTTETETVTPSLAVVENYPTTKSTATGTPYLSEEDLILLNFVNNCEHLKPMTCPIEIRPTAAASTSTTTRPRIITGTLLQTEELDAFIDAPYLPFPSPYVLK